MNGFPLKGSVMNHQGMHLWYIEPFPVERKNCAKSFPAAQRMGLGSNERLEVWAGEFFAQRVSFSSVERMNVLNAEFFAQRVCN